MPALGFDLLDRHVVHGRADEPAVLAAGTVMTYARLLERAAAVAAGLRYLGVEPGHEVAVLVADPHVRVTVVCACIRLGAVPGDTGDVTVESGPDGDVVRTPADVVPLETLRKAGNTDPAEALHADEEGYRDLVHARVGDVLATLLDGGTVS